MSEEVVLSTKDHDKTNICSYHSPEVRNRGRAHAVRKRRHAVRSGLARRFFRLGGRIDVEEGNFQSNSEVPL